MNIGYIQLGNLTADPASPTDGQIWYNTTLGKFRVRENGVTKDADTGGAGALLYTTGQGLTTAQQLEARINAGIGIDSVFGRISIFGPTGGSNQDYIFSAIGAGNNEFGNNLHEVTLLLEDLTGNISGIIAPSGDKFVIIKLIVGPSVSGFSFTETNIGITLINEGDYVVYTYNANGATLISTNVGGGGGGLTNTQIQARARLA